MRQIEVRAQSLDEDKHLGSDDRRDQIEFAQFWIRFRLVSLAAGVLMLVLSWCSRFVSDRRGAQFLFAVVTTLVVVVAAWSARRIHRRRAAITGRALRLPWERR